MQHIFASTSLPPSLPRQRSSLTLTMVRLAHLAAVLGLVASALAAPQDSTGAAADNLTITALHPDTNKRTFCLITGCPKDQFCNGISCSTCNGGGWWPLGGKSCESCPEGTSSIWFPPPTQS